MPRQLFHEHDCDRCAHLLSLTADGKAIDVYRCGRPEKEGILSTTFLLRFSNKPSDYWSAPLELVGPHMRQHAWMRAVLRALVAESDFDQSKRQLLGLWLCRTGDDLISDTASMAAIRDWILRAPVITGENNDG